MSEPIADEQRDERCQWCGGNIPAGGNACTTCGAVRPRVDVPVPGLFAQSVPGSGQATLIGVPPELDEEERKARQILIEMDAYIDKPDEAPAVPRTSDPGDDALMIIGILLIAGALGAGAGWFIAPPMIQDVFERVLGIEADGPESFRRLGAFLGALISMLFGATLATMMRR